jgi:hypothetical protein
VLPVVRARVDGEERAGAICMESELIELERQGWEALCGPSGPEFYDRLMADEGVMVFSSGTLDRAASIEAIRGASPWRSFRIESPRVVHPAPDVGVVVYLASARRGDDDEYRAWMSSTYVRDAGGAWRLALHQQSAS